MIRKRRYLSKRIWIYLSSRYAWVFETIPFVQITREQLLSFFKLSGFSYLVFVDKNEDKK